MIIDLEALKAQLAESAAGWMNEVDSRIQAKAAVEQLQAENAKLKSDLSRKDSTIGTVSNALSYAERQAAEFRSKAGELENENRRLKLDLEEARKDAERFAWYFSDADKGGEFLAQYMEGMRDHWGIQRWRDAIDAARQQKG